MENTVSTEQIQPAKSAPRYHLWDDEDKLLASIGGTTCGVYGNAGDGKRAYKLTGICGQHQWNNGTIIADLSFGDIVIYPNPYITITTQGYTKHYFAGRQRIATAIGGGGFCKMITPTDNLTNMEHVRKYEMLKYLPSYMTNQTEDHTKNEDISHHPLPELQYNDSRQTLYDINCGFKTESLCSLLEYLCHKQKDDDVFYYHPDHLGGAAWITDNGGNPIQYLHYAPYGELVANQMPYSIDERFKFTGKERDAETGYDNHDARYRWTVSGDWLSVDPLADKFIGTQPYLYCNGEPIKHVDPDGEEVINKMNPIYDKILYDAGNNIVDLKDNHIYFVSHGSSISMYPYGEENMSAEGFVDYLISNSKVWKNIEDKSSIVIVLVSCETGKGINPIAKQISELLPKATILAPTEEVKAAGSGESARIVGVAKSEVTTLGEIKKAENAGQWKAFRNGEVVGTSINGKTDYIYKDNF